MSEITEICALTGVTDVTHLTSPQTHYRSRGVLSVDHTLQTPRWSIFDEIAAKTVIVDETHHACNLYMQPILDAMPIVLRCIPTQVLSVAFLLAPGTNELLICLNSDRAFELELSWVGTLRSRLTNTSVILRTKGQSRSFGNAFVTDRVSLESGNVILLRHVDNQFSNPNPVIAKQCLDWLVQHTTYFHPKTILELYSGDGHHTCALAPLVTSLTSVEIQHRLVLAASENLKLNGIENVTLTQGDCDKFCRGITQTVEFVLVDPPRSGLSPRVVTMLQRHAATIVYISCNPEALLKDMRELLLTHKVKTLTVMDHFPGTGHLEVGVVFIRC